MSTDTSGENQGEQPRQRRILVEDILDGLITRAGRAVESDAGAPTPEVTAQAQEVVQLAQQLKDAVGRLRELDPALLAGDRGAPAPRA